MILFPKKDIIPIIVPQICFMDKYGNTNSYVEMNPSLFIEEDGNVTILVRCVNYKKLNNKDFTLYEDVSKSIYYKITGKIIDTQKLDIENFEYNILNYNYDLQIFPTYWKGLEDIRFIDKNNVLVTVPELNESGFPSIFKANINTNTISNFIPCKPNLIEKNWMPYFDNKKNKVIYNLNPFIIKSIEEDDSEEIELSEMNKKKLECYHGSTNGIILNKYERLFLIHVNKNITTHRWLIFNVKTKTIFLSEEFVFFKNSYIEFTCSLSIFNERIFISIGVNDDKAYIIEVSFNNITDIFLKSINDNTNNTNNNNQNYPTIVTMLYDIRSLENNQIERNRKLNSYIDFARKFLLRLPFPIIFFIDDNNETYDAIYNSRKEFNLLDKTHIYMCDFKNTYFYKYKERLEELQSQFHIFNGEIQHETPLYVILNNNKFDCIDKTIELNPFNSTHFIWMDFGINHVAQNTEYIYEWINKVPDKIKQLCINPYTENIDDKIMFQNIYHHTAGGLFSGSRGNLIKYSELFKKKTQQIYDENWYQIDEAVMTIVQRENPELFDLFYGDYQGIISNYLYPIHNMDLILKGSQKYIDNNKTKEAFTILCYCNKYFEEHPNDELIINYIQQHIIVDYYHNNMQLLENVVQLINMLKINNNNEIINLLNRNFNNIDYYENKHEI